MIACSTNNMLNLPDKSTVGKHGWPWIMLHLDLENTWRVTNKQSVDKEFYFLRWWRFSRQIDVTLKGFSYNPYKLSIVSQLFIHFRKAHRQKKAMIPFSIYSFKILYNVLLFLFWMKDGLGSRLESLKIDSYGWPVLATSSPLDTPSGYCHPIFLYVSLFLSVYPRGAKAFIPRKTPFTGSAATLLLYVGSFYISDQSNPQLFI